MMRLGLACSGNDAGSLLDREAVGGPIQPALPRQQRPAATARPSESVESAQQF